MKHVLYFYYDPAQKQTVIVYRNQRQITSFKRPLELLETAWNRLIFIPSCRPDSQECIYFNYSQIRRLHPCERGCQIEFYDGTTLEAAFSCRTLHRQMERCTLFLEKIINQS